MAHYIALLAGRENLLFLVTGFSEIAVTNLFLIVWVQRRKRKRKNAKKRVEEGEGEEKKSTEDAEYGESRKSPPELIGDGGNASC